MTGDKYFLFHFSYCYVVIVNLFLRFFSCSICTNAVDHMDESTSEARECRDNPCSFHSSVFFLLGFFFSLSSYISPHIRTYIHNIQILNDRNKEEQVISFDLRFKIKRLSLSSDHILLSCFVDCLNSKIRSDRVYHFSFIDIIEY
jgi:hypothetical protein